MWWIFFNFNILKISSNLNSSYKVTNQIYSKLWKRTIGGRYCIGYINDCLFDIKNISNQNPFLFRVGGENTSDNNIAYSITKQKYYTLPKLNCNRTCFHSLVYSNKNGLYCIGGWESNKLEQLLLNEKDDNKYNWKMLSNMKQQTQYATSILIQNNKNEFIITVGGYNDTNNTLDTCEIYDISKQEWKPTKNMNTPRRSCGVTEWKQKNKVIVVGGDDYKEYKSSEWYDCNKDQWYKLPSTNTPHEYNPCVNMQYSSSSFSTNNGIVVVLGNNGRFGDKKDWGHFEFYDERDASNKWQIGEEIPQILGFDDKIYNNTYFEQILSL